MDCHEAEALTSCPGSLHEHVPLEGCTGTLQEDKVEESLHTSTSSSTVLEDVMLLATSHAQSGFQGPAVCMKCGRPDHLDANCPFFKSAPLRHPDATSRGAGPHMSETDTAQILAMTTRG
eukprot:8884312-Karenia_brevis.AAC.1